MADKELSRKVISRLINKDGRTLTEIAEALGVSRQRLGQYQNGKRFPDADFIQRWQKTFSQNLMELMDRETESETNVSRGPKNSTSVQNRSDNKEKQPLQIDFATAIHKIVEENSEYVLMHRTVLEGKYRLVALEQFEIYEKELERKERELERKSQDLIRKDHQIEGLYELFRGITSKLPDPEVIKEAKKDTGV